MSGDNVSSNGGVINNEHQFIELVGPGTHQDNLALSFIVGEKTRSLCIGYDEASVNCLSHQEGILPYFRDVKYTVDVTWFPQSIKLALDLDAFHSSYPKAPNVCNHDGLASVRYMLERGKPLQSIDHVIGGSSIHIPRIIIRMLVHMDHESLIVALVKVLGDDCMGFIPPGFNLLSVRFLTRLVNVIVLLVFWAFALLVSLFFSPVTFGFLQLCDFGSMLSLFLC